MPANLGHARTAFDLRERFCELNRGHGRSHSHPDAKTSPPGRPAAAQPSDDLDAFATKFRSSPRCVALPAALAVPHPCFTSRPFASAWLLAPSTGAWQGGGGLCLTRRSGCLSGRSHTLLRHRPQRPDSGSFGEACRHPMLCRCDHGPAPHPEAAVLLFGCRYSHHI